MKFELKGMRGLAAIAALSLQAAAGAFLGWQVGSGWADVFNWPVNVAGWIGAAAGALGVPWFLFASERSLAAKPPEIPAWLRRWHSRLRDPITGLWMGFIGFAAGASIWVFLVEWADLPPRFDDWLPWLAASLVSLTSLLLWVFGRRKAAIWCAAFGLAMLLWFLYPVDAGEP